MAELRSRPNLNEPQFTMGQDLLTSCISIQIAVIRPDRPEIVDRSCRPPFVSTKLGVCAVYYPLLSPLRDIPLPSIYVETRLFLSLFFLFFAITLEEIPPCRGRPAWLRCQSKITMVPLNRIDIVVQRLCPRN